MFSHIMLGANDVEVSKRFYDAILGALGHTPGRMDDKGRCVYKTKDGILMITKPLNHHPATGANGGTVGFSATSAEAVNTWHKAGVENGGTTCEDPPGKRASGLYLGYLRDPAGNKLCAMFR